MSLLRRSSGKSDLGQDSSGLLAEKFQRMFMSCMIRPTSFRTVSSWFSDCWSFEADKSHFSREEVWSVTVKDLVAVVHVPSIAQYVVPLHGSPALAGIWPRCVLT